MKEKERRYFCDFMTKKNAKIIQVLTFVLCILIVALCIAIRFSGEVTEYVDIDRDYFEGIAEMAITEEGIDLDAIPEAVEYDIKSTNDGGKCFTYDVHSNHARAHMEIQLASNYEIISKEATYSSRVGAVIKYVAAILIYGLTFGYIGWIVISFGIFNNLYRISEKHKNQKNTENTDS